jgi:hypothetical protein
MFKTLIATVFALTMLTMQVSAAEQKYCPVSTAQQNFTPVKLATAKEMLDQFISGKEKKQEINYCPIPPKEKAIPTS